MLLTNCIDMWYLCSAGVGRTGTFIVIDRLLHQIQRENAIDVFGTTLEMRDYRCHMIQTEVCYLSIIVWHISYL